MKVGVMQPYFLPYIGYWQLIDAVDKYVIFDDVNYINRGWINRNRTLLNGKPHYINVPILGASQNKLINKIDVDTASKVINKNLCTIEMAYKKAPYYNRVFPLFKSVMCCSKINLAEYLEQSIRCICDYLEIKTEILVSSSIDKNCELKSQDKIIDICSRLGADEYINAIGGQELYSVDVFEKSGIKLSFIKTDDIQYMQFKKNEFISNLSILDVMMFNSVSDIQSMLKKYCLV